MEYQEITKDNIVAVLEYNKSLGLKIDDIRIQHKMICYTDNSGKIAYNSKWDLCTNWLAHIEIDLGRLKPLPKANPFDAVKVGQWIKRKIGKRNEVNRWFQRNSLFDYFQRPEEWDLTDTRDYNPDEEIVLKVGDNIKFKSTTDSINVDTIVKFDYVGKIIEANRFCNRFERLDLIESVNGKQGKYVIPPFDFEQTLLDAGFTKSKNTLGFKLIKNGVRCDLYSFIKPIPANAERLIKAAAILNDLELI